MSPRKSSRSPRKGPRRSKKRGRAGEGHEKNPLVTLAGLLALGITAVALGIGLMSDGEGTTVADGEDSVAANVSVKWEGDDVEVEVLNGGGVAGMAAEVTEQLRLAGFDVVIFGNAPTFDPDRPSQVIDRVGRTDAAQAVAAALGIDIVLSDPDPNLYVDVTVVVGGAWTPQQGSSPDDSGQRPQWDSRTWFGR